MTLDEARQAIAAVEPDLPNHPFVVVHTFSRDGRNLRVSVTERLRTVAKKGRVWNSKSFLTAFKNASYGFHDSRAISAGGADGIFRLSRDHKPANQMMKKIFDRFLDRADSEVSEIARALEAPLESLWPVRLVSHHLRLLGLLHRGPAVDTLVLIDYDDAKH